MHVVRLTTLAFSCERTKMDSDQSMMVGAFVCCNGLLACTTPVLMQLADATPVVAPARRLRIQGESLADGAEQWRGQMRAG
jgi:hypothetical protein